MKIHNCKHVDAEKIAALKTVDVKNFGIVIYDPKAKGFDSLSNADSVLQCCAECVAKIIQ